MTTCLNLKLAPASNDDLRASLAWIDDNFTAFATPLDRAAARSRRAVLALELKRRAALGVQHRPVTHLRAV